MSEQAQAGRSVGGSPGANWYRFPIKDCLSQEGMGHRMATAGLQTAKTALGVQEVPAQQGLTGPSCRDSSAQVQPYCSLSSAKAARSVWQGARRPRVISRNLSPEDFASSFSAAVARFAKTDENPLVLETRGFGPVRYHKPSTICVSSPNHALRSGQAAPVHGSRPFAHIDRTSSRAPGVVLRMILVAFRSVGRG